MNFVYRSDMKQARLSSLMHLSATQTLYLSLRLHV